MLRLRESHDCIANLRFVDAINFGPTKETHLVSGRRVDTERTGLTQAKSHCTLTLLVRLNTVHHDQPEVSHQTHRPGQQTPDHITISLLLATGFIITSLASYFVARSSIRQNIVDNELPLTSDNIYSEIQKDLVRPTFISSMMSRDTFLRNWFLQGEVYTTRITQYLREIKEHYKTLTSFFVSEQTRTYYQANGVLKKVVEGEPRDAWYFRVRAMQTPYEINVDPDMANRDTLTIFINFRVFDFATNYIGAAGVGLTVDSVRNLVNEYQKRYQRRVSFVDRNGQIMVSGTNFRYEGKNIREVPGLDRIARTALASTETALQYEDRGETHLLNVRFLPELGWYLFVERTDIEAISAIRSALFINIVLCIAVTAIVALLVSLTVGRYQKHLETMASTDFLTGFVNRHALALLFTQMLKDLKRVPQPVSLMMIDIDHFKRINDLFGHLVGTASSRNSSAYPLALRDSDITSRWGEEFLVVLRLSTLSPPSKRPTRSGARSRPASLTAMDRRSIPRSASA